MRTFKLFFIAAFMLTSTLFAQSLNDAIKLTTNEQFQSADQAFQKLIQLGPGNGEYYFYYGENYFKSFYIKFNYLISIFTQTGNPARP